MDSIRLGRILATKRREKGITQEELAAYIGVTKAAVSKWETGQSYPDIVLLPQLAAYFNISIDTLVGYEPQLTKEAIAEQYRTLSAAFATEPFEDVLARCEALARQYYACFPLLFQLGMLLINHVPPTGEAETQAALYRQALSWFLRIYEESDDITLRQNALSMQAYVHIALGDPNTARILLEDQKEPEIPAEMLLARAYQLLGDAKNAQETMQVRLFTLLIHMVNAMTGYLTMLSDEPNQLSETCHRMDLLAEAFQLRTLHPTLLGSFHLAAAALWLQAGDEAHALSALEQYVDIMTGDIYPLTILPDPYFTKIGPWLSDQETGTTLPRDDRTIKQSSVDGVLLNPSFAPLSDNPRFRALSDRLRAIL